MKRSEMALIANESEAVVFEERECSLDLLVLFSIKRKGKRKQITLTRHSAGQADTTSLRSVTQGDIRYKREVLILNKSFIHPLFTLNHLQNINPTIQLPHGNSTHPFIIPNPFHHLLTKNRIDAIRGRTTFTKLYGKTFRCGIRINFRFGILILLILKERTSGS